MTQLFANNAVSILGTSITATATSLDVTANGGANFPSPSGGDYFLLTLIGLGSTGQEETWEIVKVTGRSSDTLTIVRGQEGTTAQSWLAGVRVELRMTADTAARAQELATDTTPQLSGNLDGQTYDISTTGDITAADVSCDNLTVSGSAVELGFTLSTIKTASFTAVNLYQYPVDTTSGSVTMTLPAAPSIGDRVAFLDTAHNFETNNLTLARNGSKIIGLAEDMTVDIDGSSFMFVYISAADGWVPEGGLAGGYTGSQGATGATGATGPAVDLFFAQKTTDQLNFGTSFTDVVSWDSPDKSDTPYSFNATTGVLTINKTGWVSFTVDLQISAGSTKPNGQVQLIGGASTVLYTAGSSGWTAAGDMYSMGISNFLHNCTSGDTFKVKLKSTQGTSDDLTAAFISVIAY